MKKPPAEEDTLFYKIAAFCAFRERCSTEVIARLKALGADGRSAATIMKRLREEGYLSDERFLLAYVRGKFNIKKWGKVKIAYGLKAFGFSRDEIEKALATIDMEEYTSTLAGLIGRKKSSFKGLPPGDVLLKLMRYATQLGYEYELIKKIAGEKD